MTHIVYDSPYPARAEQSRSMTLNDLSSVPYRLSLLPSCHEQYQLVISLRACASCHTYDLPFCPQAERSGSTMVDDLLFISRRLGSVMNTRTDCQLAPETLTSANHPIRKEKPRRRPQGRGNGSEVDYPRARAIYHILHPTFRA